MERAYREYVAFMNKLGHKAMSWEEWLVFASLNGGYEVFVKH